MTPLVLALALLAAPPADDPTACRIGLKVHADAAALATLPRFDYQARHRWGFVKALPAVDKVGLAELTQALDGDISQAKGEGLAWHEEGFSWDETYFLHDERPGDADLNHSAVFGTRTEGWHRAEAKDRSRRSFTRRAGVGTFWNDGKPYGSGFVHVWSNYLRLTPQTWWWGTANHRDMQALTHQPLAGATWAILPAEPFDNEPCDVVEVSSQRGRFQRLWVSRAAGRVRGVLTFYSGPDGPDALVRFRDYREVTPGFWVPLAEDRTFSWGSRKVKGKRQLIRQELRVTSAKTGIDLSDRVAALLPTKGDPVQDQRFAAAVNTKYDPARPDAEIQKEADAIYARRLEDAEVIKAATAPVAAMVGKPAPELPADGWVGGKRPDVAGKPYLVHVWAVWCGPCKNDLPLLKKLAEGGVTVVGLHPSGTPADDVAKVVADRKLGYPTHVPAGGGRSVAAYPVELYPYCVVVDAKGNVAAHGPLDEAAQALRRLTAAAP